MGPHFIQILKASGLSAGCSFLSQEAKLCAHLGGAHLGGPTFPNARVKVSGLTAESTALTSSSGDKKDIHQTVQPAVRPGPSRSESLLTTHMGQQTKALLCPPQPAAHRRPGAMRTGFSVCAPPLLLPLGHLPALRAHTPQTPADSSLCTSCTWPAPRPHTSAAASSCSCLGSPGVSWAHVRVRGWRGRRTAWIHVIGTPSER